MIREGGTLRRISCACARACEHVCVRVCALTKSSAHPLSERRSWGWRSARGLDCAKQTRNVKPAEVSLLCAPAARARCRCGPEPCSGGAGVRDREGRHVNLAAQQLHVRGSRADRVRVKVHVGRRSIAAPRRGGRVNAASIRPRHGGGSALARKLAIDPHRAARAGVAHAVHVQACART